jgi:hypothetical protein
MSRGGVCIDHKLHGTTNGVEVYMKWKPASRWTISPGYSFLQMHLLTASNSPRYNKRGVHRGLEPLAVLKEEPAKVYCLGVEGSGEWRLAYSGPGQRSGPARKRRFRAIFSVLAALSLACLTMAQTPASSEYEVKAAFLFHFAQFVKWPEEAFKDPNNPLIYCTIGEDSFHGSLDAALNGKTIGARSSRVVHFKQPQEIQGCQVLFIAAREKKSIPAILASTKGNSVLTVGESEHFVQDGGMIGFLLEENKIRFEVNLEAAQKANLKISSRLLALAKSVVGVQRGT